MFQLPFHEPEPVFMVFYDGQRTDGVSRQHFETSMAKRTTPREYAIYVVMNQQSQRLYKSLCDGLYNTAKQSTDPANTAATDSQ